MMNVGLLQELCSLPGVPGRESRVAQFIETEIFDSCDNYYYDAMGNLHAVIKESEKAETVMLACHMDEIGFMVNYIDDNGFIYVQPLGGFDPRNLFSRRVLICTDEGDYPAVMNPAGLPVHLSKPADRTNVPAADEFVLDTGMGKEAKELISIGDFVVMDEPFMEMGTKVVSKALDNRVACYLGIRTLKELYRNGGNSVNVHVVFTVQEEVGLRGAKTATWHVEPNYAIGVDVTLSCDTPGVPANKTTTTQGKGFALGVKDASFVSDPWLVSLVEDVAEDNSLDYQKVVSAGGGMDGAAMQQAMGGCKAVAISVGTRYIHTVTEMVDVDDLMMAEVAIIQTIRRL